MSGAFGGVNVSTLGEQADSAYDSRKDEMAMEANHLALADARRNDEQKQALHNQQMFINDNYDAIANDVKEIDPEADDYDDRMASLPLGVRESPLLRSKMESLEQGRKGFQAGRAKAYASAVQKEKTDLADWEEEYLPHLSLQEQQDFRNNKMFNPDFNARSAHMNYGQSAVMGKSSFDMLQTINDQAKVTAAGFAEEDKRYSAIEASEKSYLSTVAAMKKAKEDQDGSLYTQQTEALDNALMGLMNLKVSIEETRIGRASMRNRQIESARASKIKAYNHHVKLKLAREGIGFVNKMAEIEGKKDMDVDTKAKAKNAVAHQAQPLYSYAHKELAATHEYIFNPVVNKIPESFRYREPTKDDKGNPEGVKIQEELTREVILAFNEYPDKQVHFVGNKMYVNPFNAPSEDDLGKAVLKNGYAEQIRKGKTGQDFQGVLNKFWKTKEEKAKATRWILSTIAGEDMSQDDLNSLGGAQKAFFKKLAKHKNLENNDLGFDGVTKSLLMAAE